MSAAREAVWWRGTWNVVLRSAAAVGWSGSTIELERVLDDARRTSGLDDFGDRAFLEPLELLLREFRQRARADATGRHVFRSFLRQALVNRLRIRRAMCDWPEIGRTPIAAPMFLVGMPRTGTTLLQGLLSAIEGMRTPLHWETKLPPTPPALATERELAAHLRGVEREVHVMNLLSPRLRAAHEVGARLPEECNPLLMASMRARLPSMMFACPEYSDYVFASGFGEAYEWHRHHLEVLSFGAPARTWLLKAPAHVSALPDLLHAYPDARVVFTHRDPREAVGSMAALATCLHMLISPEIDRREIGATVVNGLAQGQVRGHAARDRWPAGAPPFIDVRYETLVARPHATVRGILEHFGMPVPPDLDGVVDRYLREHPQHRAGVHRYTLAEFDIAESSIRAVFDREYTLLA